MAATSVPTPPLEALRDAVAGAVIGPDDGGYDGARMPWNRVEQRPAAVVEAASADDVQAAVSFAAEHELAVAAQPTGHSSTGGLDGAVLLRTRGLDAVTIDPDARVARIGAGALWRDVQGPAAEHGLAGLAGTAPHVGAVGYTMGGGFGWLGRQHGLCCSRVRAADLVLADGSTRRADAATEPDLLWGLRGGGGNFGIVTSMDLELVEAPEVFAGVLAFPLERTRELLGAWRDWALDVPEAISSVLTILRLPDVPFLPPELRGAQMVVIGACHAGGPRGESAFAPLRELGPFMDTLGPMPPSRLGELHNDPEDPIPSVDTAAMVGELPDEALDALDDAARPRSDSPLVFTELRHAGGAFARPAPGGGAVDHLEGQFLLHALGVPMGPAAAALPEGLERVRSALAPWIAPSLLPNFVTRREQAPGAFRPATLARLRAIKSQVDPDARILCSHPLDA